MTAPENNSLYPAGLELGFRLDVSGAAFDNLKVRMYGVGAEVSSTDLPRLRMMQYGDDGSVTDITSAHTSNYVEGSTQHNSIFAVVAPLGVFDKVGPEMSLKGIAHEAAGLLYISSASPVAIQAVDRSTNPYVLAGVATSYYKLGAEPSAGCLAAPETCGAAVYAGPVSLPEGAHSLYSWSSDKAGNVGGVKAAELRFDGTPPVSELALNGTPITAGATAYATSADVLTLAGADTMSNGVSNGDRAEFPNKTGSNTWILRFL